MVSSIPMATASRAIDGGRRQYAKGALVFCMMASLVFFAPSARGRDTYAPKGREVFEPPVVRNQACTKDTDCQPGLNCERVEFHYSHDDVHRCAYLPTFVFPLRTPPVPSSEIGRPAPGWFQTGGPLSTGFPKTWDLKRGPLPPAPQGYMWTYAPEDTAGGVFVDAWCSVARLTRQALLGICQTRSNRMSCSPRIGTV
jgi:hypothetical protein